MIKRFLFILLGIFFFLTSRVDAILYVSPVNGGSRGGTTTFYYYVISGTVSDPFASSTSFFTPDTTMIDIRGNINTSAIDDNAFAFSVRSTAQYSLTSSQSAVLTVNFNVASGGTGGTRAVPIAGFNTGGGPTLCYTASGGRNPQCRAFNQPGTIDLNYSYAVQFPSPGATMYLYLYLNQICADAAGSNVTIQGCTGGAVTDPGNTNVPTQFTFSIGLYTGPLDQITAPTTTVLDSMIKPLGLSLQTSPPAAGGLSCPSLDDFVDNYDPGDGRFTLANPNIFGIPSPPGGGAPYNSLTMVAVRKDIDPGAQPDISSSFASSGINTLVTTITNVLLPGVFSGFINSTQANPVSYDISFLGLDAAGGYTPPASLASCLYSDIELTQIKGSRVKGNCFIATAAFGSRDAAPVLFLQEFRDQVLKATSFGRSFINWYYSWSPRSAEWLMDHPWVRAPVLLFLAPIEGAVWLYLHPYLSLTCIVIVFLFNFSVCWTDLKKRSRGIG